MLHFMVGIWLLAIALFASAQQQTDLYSSSTLVLNQSNQIRQQTAPDALAKVFIRVSGNRNIIEHPAIQQALKDAKSYLYEFEYSSTDEALIIDGVEHKAVRLLMKFSDNLVNNLLETEQLPYWSTNRPDILLWAAKADGKGGQRFIDNEASVANAFVDTAAERGIILVKPVFDLEDRLALPVPRLWALDAATIAKASGRYQTDAVLAGRLLPLDKDRWKGNFTLFYQAQEKSFVNYGKNSEAVAMAIFEQVADYFSATFTSIIDDQSSLKRLVLTVNNVNDFATYTSLLSYLENLTMVQAVNLIAVKANQIQVTLHHKGDQTVIFRTFSLDKHLIEDKTKINNTTLAPGNLAANPPGTAANPLQFIWQSR